MLTSCKAAFFYCATIAVVVTAVPKGARADDRAEAQEAFKRGRAAFDKGAYREALEAFEIANKKLPLPELAFNIAKCHDALNDEANARQWYLRSLKRDPESLAAPNARARLVELIVAARLRERGAPPGRQDLNALPPLSRTAVVGHFTAAQTHMRDSKWDAALREFETAYALVPEPELLFNMASAHERAGRKEKARAMYLEYLAADRQGRAASEAEQHLVDLELEVDDERGKRPVELRVKQQSSTPVADRRVPVYRRWWLWTTVGGVIAVGAGLAIGLGIRESQRDPFREANARYVFDVAAP